MPELRVDHRLLLAARPESHSDAETESGKGGRRLPFPIPRPSRRSSLGRSEEDPPIPRITKVYTRTGDDGTTALGGGQRLPKDALRIECYGTVDELNSVLGTAIAADAAERLRTMLSRIQNELFHLGSDLCILEEDKERMPVPQIEERHVDALESDIDALQEDLEPLTNFILPAGTPAAASLHLGRTVCRRAERCLVALAREEPIGAFAVRYLNRLSDLLFVMARWENHARGVADVTWDSRA